MNDYLSRKISIISALAMIMVVFLHAFNLTSFFKTHDYDEGYVNVFIQYFISQGVTRVAVPFFFFISGYVFFINNQGRFQDFVARYRTRLKTLVVPYVCWYFFFIAFIFGLFFLPGSKQFFAENSFFYNLRHASMGELLQSMVFGPVKIYHLWFLRDLILLVLISPLIYFLIRKTHLLFVIVFLTLWLGPVEYLVTIAVEGILFFGLGAFIAIERNTLLLRKFNKRFFVFWFVLWMILSSIIAIANICNLNHYIDFYLLKVDILVGLIALWTLYDIVVTREISSLSFLFKVSKYSFFVYAFHGIPIRMVSKVMIRFLGTNEWSLLAVYFMAPIFVIVCAILLAFLLNKYVPAFYKIITGNR